MRITIQMVVEQEERPIFKKDVVYIEKQDVSLETLGLTLGESKLITSNIQKNLIEVQAADYIAKSRSCSSCGRMRSIKGYHSLKYRTLFGKISIRSPRLYECKCHTHKQSTISPLAELLPERTAPELQYLESKWASLMSYKKTSAVLEEVFPIQVHNSSIIHNAQQVSLRLEQELGEEQYTFMEGSEYERSKLPNPGAPIIVGIDGGYIHAREGNNRKAGWFEAVVGKSMQEQQAPKRFGFVVDYNNSKPKRRLYEALKNQGLQMNQSITFFSDGGDDVQHIQLYISPASEHILDWFHITMRLTVMNQMIKGVTTSDKSFDINQISQQLESAKWYIWHGNVFRALQNIDSARDELEMYFFDNKGSKGYKLWQAVEEFYTYIAGNSHLIVNYGERYRHGENISTAFAESTVNELISQRMAKKQQMRWTKKGAHLLLQLRIKTLDNQLRQSFCQWYPKMEQETAYEQASIPIAA